MPESPSVRYLPDQIRFSSEACLANPAPYQDLSRVKSFPPTLVSDDLVVICQLEQICSVI